MATRLIDDLAYEGVDVRAVIANELRQTVKKKKKQADEAEKPQASTKPLSFPAADDKRRHHSA